MNVGLISDPHANYSALQIVLNELCPVVERIFCAGDLTGYYAEPNKVIQTILDRGVIFTIGNHDWYIDHPPNKPNALLTQSIELTRSVIRPEYQNLLTMKEAELHLNVDGLRLAIFHGSPWDPLEEYIYPDYPEFNRFEEVEADVIILGHTHRPFTKWVAGRLIINPGSCGQPRDGDPRASCAILNTTTKEVTIIRLEYDASEELRAIQEKRLSKKLVRYLPVTV